MRKHHGGASRSPPRPGNRFTQAGKSFFWTEVRLSKIIVQLHFRRWQPQRYRHPCRQPQDRARRPAPGRRSDGLPPSSPASAETVLVAKMSATMMSGVSSQARIRATVCVANTESPPNAKKSSSTPTASAPSTSPMIAAIRGFHRRRRRAPLGRRRLRHGGRQLSRDHAPVDLTAERVRNLVDERQMLRNHVRGNEIGHEPRSPCRQTSCGSSAWIAAASTSPPPVVVTIPATAVATPGMWRSATSTSPSSTR